MKQLTTNWGMWEVMISILIFFAGIVVAFVMDWLKDQKKQRISSTTDSAKIKELERMIKEQQKYNESQEIKINDQKQDIVRLREKQSHMQEYQAEKWERNDKENEKILTVQEEQTKTLHQLNATMQGMKQVMEMIFKKLDPA